MSLSDKIISNQNCLDYAKRKGGQNYLDYYNDVWLKIREKELKGHKFIEGNVFWFFKKVFDNVRFDYLRKQKRCILVAEVVTENTTGHDPIRKFENWISSKPENEFDKFQKNLIEIVSKTESKSEAIEMIAMDRSMFYRYYNPAKKRVIDECT